MRAPHELMEQALRQDPGNPLGHVYLAMALERAGQSERAVEVYQDAIEPAHLHRPHLCTPG